MKIALATATRDRPNLLSTLIGQIMASTYPDGHQYTWHVSDDHSRQDVYQMLVGGTTGIEAAIRGPVTLTRNASVLGCDRNVVKVLYAAALSGADWVVSVDSDMLLHPAWLAKLLEARAEIEKGWAQAPPGHQGELCALSAFNSRMHGSGGIIRPGIVLKGSCGGACTMIRGTLLRELRLDQQVTDRWGNGEPGWDWKLCDAITQRHGLIAALSPSYAQHVGRGGAHGKDPAKFDEANDFIGVRG